MTFIPRLAEIVWSSIKLWLFLRHKYHEMSTFFETIMKYNRILAMSILTLVAMTMSTSSSVPSSQETTIYPATWTETMKSASPMWIPWLTLSWAIRLLPYYIKNKGRGYWASVLRFFVSKGKMAIMPPPSWWCGAPWCEPSYRWDHAGNTAWHDEPYHACWWKCCR